MNRGKFRRKVLTDLLTSAWTIVPAVVGASLLTIGWAIGGVMGPLGMGAAAGFLAGAGSVMTRWIFHSDEITQTAFNEIRGEALRSKQDSLDDLDRRLQRDRDPRTETSLRQLRELYFTFEANKDMRRAMDSRTAFEIENKVEKLFEGCILSLEHSLELWGKSKGMKTKEGLVQAMKAREHVLEEIQASVLQMAKTIDGIQALTFDDHEGADLARIRGELDESLRVARRVEERMRSLDRELSADIGKRHATGATDPAI